MKLLACAVVLGLVGVAGAACSASSNHEASGGASGVTSSSAAGPGAGGGQNGCGTCNGKTYNSCDGGTMKPIQCPDSCTPNMGCTSCIAGIDTCSGNDVVACDDSGNPGMVVMTCDAMNGQVCDSGACKSACQLAADSPSNLGCEFWPVDLDLADGPTDPAGAPWGIVIANAGTTTADVVIERNDAPLGMPVQTALITKVTLNPGDLGTVSMPTREVDCGAYTNDHKAPGTCLTSNAYHVTSTAPIVIYQFNNLIHGYSTDASLLLPTSSLGTKYRVIGWPSGHPVDLPGAFVERTYVTVVGTQPNTHVTVSPTWRIRGNAPIMATDPGGKITATLGPFDVLNLESDDATLDQCFKMQNDPLGCTDLTGTTVESDLPVVVFSGTESSGSPPTRLNVPTPPNWDPDWGGCCLQHLEEQLFPLDAIGKTFVITRSPVRSTMGTYEEPDVLRFVGAAEPAQVKTNLPAPMDSFTLMPGQIVDTWTDHDIIVTADAPILIGQFLVAGGYVDGPAKGDPSFTIFPPVEQARKDYVFLSPVGWKESWVVISAVQGTKVKIDGADPGNCIVKTAGTLEGKTYEARRCPLAEGVHRLAGDEPFGIVAYGYADADAYAFAGGAGVKKIYDPPPIQ